MITARTLALVGWTATGAGLVLMFVPGSFWVGFALVLSGSMFRWRSHQ